MGYRFKDILTTFLLLFFTTLVLFAASYSFGVVSAKELGKTGNYIFDCTSTWTEFQVEMAYSTTDRPFMCEGSKRHQEAVSKIEKLSATIEALRVDKSKKEITPVVGDECIKTEVLNLIRNRYSEDRTVTQVLDYDEFALRFKDNTNYQSISEASFTFMLYNEQRNKDDSITCFSQLEVTFVDPSGNSLVEKKSVGWKMINTDGKITLVDFKF